MKRFAPRCELDAGRELLVPRRAAMTRRNFATIWYWLTWLLLAAEFVGTSCAAVQAAEPAARLVPIGPAFAANDINVVSFRQSGLTSVVRNGVAYQFAAYYRHEDG